MFIKALLIKLFILPRGTVFLVGASLMGLALLYFPYTDTAQQSNSANRDQFPGQRRGGGTHWIPPVFSPLA